MSEPLSIRLTLVRITVYTTNFSAQRLQQYWVCIRHSIIQSHQIHTHVKKSIHRI